MRLWHSANLLTGFGENNMSFFFAEMAAVLFAPALVFVYKRFFRAFKDAFAMPELRHKVYPFLASIGAGGTAEHAVCG